MARKRLAAHIPLALVAGLLLTGCAGSQGPEGPVGPAGPAGLMGPPGPTGEVATASQSFVGSDRCSACHEAEYAKFVLSGHRYNLRPIEDGRPPTFPHDDVTGRVAEPPAGYTWEDISYVIGGFGWKARFIDQQGYIITGDADATTQYNLGNDAVGAEAGWVAYKQGEERPYDCGGCHTTGYRPDGHQDDRPGIVGTWAFPGVQCEACHGPGGDHAGDPYSLPMTVDYSATACIRCHQHETGVLEIADGFIQHEDNYGDLFPGKHAILDCVTCHDPHAGVVQLREADQATVRIGCAECHFDQAENFKLAPHPRQCTICHMPSIIRNAAAEPSLFTADMRTHMVAIDPNQVEQFTADEPATTRLALNSTCRQCHAEGGEADPRSDAELIAAATGFHGPFATPTPVPTPEGGS